MSFGYCGHLISIGILKSIESLRTSSRYPFFVVATMVLFVFSDLGLGTVVNIVFRAGDPDLLVVICCFLVISQLGFFGD